MSKRTMTWLIIAGVAVAGYLLYRWYRAQQQAGASPTGSLGSNLNSVAPELIGGSSGPSLGPAVSLPVNITLTENIPSGGGMAARFPQTDEDADDMGRVGNPGGGFRSPAQKMPPVKGGKGGKNPGGGFRSPAQPIGDDEDDTDESPGTTMIPSNVTTNIPMNSFQTDGSAASSEQPDVSPGVTVGEGE